MVAQPSFLDLARKSEREKGRPPSFPELVKEWERAKERRSTFLDLVKAIHITLPKGWSGTTKHVVTVLFTFADSTDGSGIYASIETIAAHAGEPRRTIERVYRELGKGGLLLDDGFRRVKKSSGEIVRVKCRRLMLDAIRRAAASDTEPAVDDGLEEHIEPAENGGLNAAAETAANGGFGLREDGIEPAISGSTAPVEPAISGTEIGVEPATGGAQTKSRNQERREEPRGMGNIQPQTLGSLFPQTRPEPESSRPGQRAKPRGQIKPDWSPPPAGIVYAQDHGIPERDLSKQVAKFVNYHTAKGSLMADWPAAWRTWCDNFTSFNGPGRSNGAAAGRASAGSGGGLMGAVMRRYGRDPDV